MTSESKTVKISIDIGTENTVCVFYDNQNQEIKKLIFPGNLPFFKSIVDFSTLPVTIAVPNPNAISQTKRLLGKKFQDEKIQEMIKSGIFPYTIVEGENGLCKIVCKNKQKENVQISIAEIYVCLVHYVKKSLISCIKNDFDIEAIVTIPCGFTDNEIRLTKRAVEAVGIKFIGQLKEPQAAIYAYHKKLTEDGFYLVFDLGAGTFDYTIVKISKNGKMKECFHSDGDAFLGGLNLDEELAKLVLKKWKENVDEPLVIERKFNIANEQGRKKFASLKGFVEKYKIDLCTKSWNIYNSSSYINKTEEERYQLSMNEIIQIDLSMYDQMVDVVVQITSEEFEKCIRHHLMRCINIIEEGFPKNKYHVPKSLIKEIILVGGSSQIVGIKRMLKNSFPKAKIKDDIDPHMVVAIGALQYQIDRERNIPDVAYKNVLLHDIFLESAYGPEMIIEKGVELPHSHEFVVRINNDGFSTKLYEGYETVNGIKKPKHLKNYGHYFKAEKEEFVMLTLNVDYEGYLTMKAVHPNGMVFDLQSNLEKEEQREVPEKYYQDFIRKYLEK